MKKSISILTLILIFFIPALLIHSCKKDLCKDKVCLNGGACQDGNCICPSGYTGVNCELTIQTDPCQGISCLNGGTCINGTCDCPPGFTGPNCATVVNNNPCQGIICYNGGNCANGVCNCPTGFTGSDCSIVVPLSSVTITKIIVTNYPQTSGGSGWDLDGGPDPFLTINQGTSCSTTATTGTVSNATGASLTYTNGFPLTLNNPNSPYSICMYDYDQTSADDYMTGLYFTPADEKSGYPSSFTLSTSEFSMTVFVTWNFQ